MTISINYGSAIRLMERWSDLKATVASKTLLLQSADLGSRYEVFALDGSVVYVSQLVKADQSTENMFDANYTKADNDADVADFEASYLATSNKTLAKREADGRMTVRVTTSKLGSLFRLRTFAFVTSTPSSLHSKRPDGTDYRDVIITCFDADNADVTAGDLTTAVKTQLDFEPLYDQELIGGWLVTDAALVGGTTDAFFVGVVGAPDVPAEYGGSIDFVSETNLELVDDTHLNMDGRGTTLVRYDPVYHTGKIRFIFKHQAGALNRHQIFLETFR